MGPGGSKLIDFSTGKALCPAWRLLAVARFAICESPATNKGTGCNGPPPINWRQINEFAAGQCVVDVVAATAVVTSTLSVQFFSSFYQALPTSPSRNWHTKANTN